MKTKRKVVLVDRRRLAEIEGGKEQFRIEKVYNSVELRVNDALTESQVKQLIETGWEVELKHST